MPEYRDIFQRTGRVTHGNPVAAPPGTAIVAKNWETTRDNCYKKVRGRDAYGSGLPSQNISQLLSYKDRLICHMANNTLYYDSDGAGTFTQYQDADAGTTFSAPETDYLVQGLENAGNYYISTSTGIQVVESLTGDFRDAGVPQGLGFDLHLITGTFLANNKEVAYRVLFSYEDANSNTIRGGPSERQGVTNTSGASKNVQLRIYLPDGITASHYVEIHRSSITASGTTPPEDFQLVYQAQPTAAEITAGVMTVDDVLIDGLRGTELYTNTTQEGIQNANSQPPLANSITEYKDYIRF